MCEKIKVSKKIGEQLDYILDKPYNTKEKIVRKKINDISWFAEEHKLVRDMDFDELCTALYVGYEVEKTTAELLEDLGMEIKMKSVSPLNKDYAKGAMDTIKFFKENFEIKEINDND